jgi:hypothetical protein
MTSARAASEWLEHHYFRTYQIADFAEAVVSEPFAFIRDLLQTLVVEDGIFPFLPNWQRYSALHRFVAFIADQLFDSDCEGPNLVRVGPERLDPPPRILPVDAALKLYNIDDDPFIPPPELCGPDANPVALQDAYYDYFQDLRWSGAYEALLERLADEVFFVMFANRAALQSLNSFLAMYVQDLGPESFDPDCDLSKLFHEEGRIARKTPPKWARSAVFFREQGVCARCGTDLSGLLSALPVRHFDHIVPLANGGLNDVTNLQLLCESCNSRKAAGLQSPNRRHRRWYRAS